MRAVIRFLLKTLNGYRALTGEKENAVDESSTIYLPHMLAVLAVGTCGFGYPPLAENGKIW